MVLVHDTSIQCALQMYEVSSKYLNGYQVLERTRFCDGQTDGRTDKWGKTISQPCRGGGGGDIRAQGYKTSFILNSQEHEICYHGFPLTF